MTTEQVGEEIVLKLTSEEAKMLELGALDLSEIARDCWECVDEDDDEGEIDRSKKEEEFFWNLQSNLWNLRNGRGSTEKP